MREIKFRGFRTDGGGWIYGNLQVPKPPFDKYFMWDEGHQHEVIPETVGQYTGLKDKNRKDIYEGDIIRQSLGFSSYEFIPPYHPTGHDGYGSIDCIGTIVFLKSSFVFRCDKVLKETSVWHDEYNLTRHFLNRNFGIENCELMGNIHENPELL